MLYVWKVIVFSCSLRDKRDNFRNDDQFEGKRLYGACSPWNTTSESISLVLLPTSLLIFLELGNWTSRLYFCAVVFEFGLGKGLREGSGYPMSMGVLFNDVGAFEWAFDQHDWCNFRYTFSRNGIMLHLMHFRRFFTKVLLSAMSGVPSKYVVDMLTQITKDAPSHSASGWQTPRVTWPSDLEIHPWAVLWSYAPPSFVVNRSKSD